MSIILRWHDSDHLSVYANDRLALSAANTDDVPGSTDEPTIGPATVAAYTVQQLARALDVEVRIEGDPT